MSIAILYTHHVPALPNVANTLKVSLKFTYQNDTDVVTRFYMAYSGTAPTSAQLTTMAGTLGTNWATIFAAQMSNELTLTEVTITDLTSPTSAIGVSTANHAGTNAGAPLAAGVATLLNFSVSRRYRGGKPRAYLPCGVAGDLFSASAWSTSYISVIQGGWTTWISDVIAAGAVWGTVSGQVNVSYYSGFTNFTGPTGRTRARSTVRATVPAPDVVTAVAVNAKPGSQRRRNLH